MQVSKMETVTYTLCDRCGGSRCTVQEGPIDDDDGRRWRYVEWLYGPDHHDLCPNCVVAIIRDWFRDAKRETKAAP